jgi:ribonuclease HI
MLGEHALSKGIAKIFVDGGSRGNPGPGGAGAVIIVDGKTKASISKYLGTVTNNVAEYSGLLIALERALELGIQDVEVSMDSELVVKQMKGLYKVKNEKLKPLFQKAVSLSSQFASFKIAHIRREFNKAADELANEAMDLAESRS